MAVTMDAAVLSLLFAKEWQDVKSQLFLELVEPLGPTSLRPSGEEVAWSRTWPVIRKQYH